MRGPFRRMVEQAARNRRRVQFHMFESKDAFEHQAPAEYVEVLTARYGPPDEVSAEQVRWVDKVPGMAEVTIKDELIDHDFPSPHKDFVYSTREMDVPPEVIDDLLKVSGSIIVDDQKGTVTARCGKLVKNAVTLGFVDDVANGRLDLDDPMQLKREYARRIHKNEVPSWWKEGDI